MIPPERLHRIEQQLGEALYEAALRGIKRGTHRALTRDEATSLLAQHGFPPLEPVLAFEDVFGGLDLCGLQLGLGATPHFASYVSPDRGAVPIGTGPGSAVYWMDDAGDCYDDTDLEWCIPVGGAARGLLDYWLLRLHQSRWSGVVHGYIAQLESIEPDELARLLGTTAGGIAVGPTAVWSRRAIPVTETVPATRSWSTGATFSSPDVTSFVDVLRVATRARPDLRIYLVQPSLPVSTGNTETAILRLPCVRPDEPSRDAVLFAIPHGATYRLELAR